MLRETFARAIRCTLRSLMPAGVIALAVTLAAGGAEAKTPGKTYCFNGICHEVKTIAEMAALVGRDETFSTSYYDDCKRDRYNPCGLTSSGEPFDADAPDNAASPIYPDGSILLVRNPGNGKSAVVRVNNAGPYHGKRKLDVSRATAEALGFKNRGVAKLQVRVVAAPDKSEARYKKNRHYARVPGVIGTFASLDQAGGSALAAMGLEPKSKLQIASADGIVAAEAVPTEVGGSPADELRAVARRTLGIGRGTRIIAPLTLTAEALYGQITQAN